MLEVENKMRKRLIQYFVVTIILIFLGNLLLKSWGELSHFHWKLNYLYLLKSVIFLFFIFILCSFGWMMILNKLNVSISFKKSLEIWVASLIGKYIPGKVWHVLGRVYLGQKMGIPKSKMSLATILEIIFTHSSGIIIFFFSLIFWKDIAFLNQIWPYLIIFLFLSLAVVHPFVLQRTVNYFLKLLKKEEISINISFKDILLLIAFYLFLWIFYGISIYFLTRSFYPLAITSLPIISGIWAISFTLGFVTFIVPGGIGVREGVIVFLLQSLIPTHLALLVAISSRVLLTVLELFFIWILINFDVSLSKYYKEMKLASPEQVDR